MIIKQISAFIENKSGGIHEIAAVLAENNINIRALSLADTADFGILRLIVDQPEAGCRAIEDSGVSARLTDVAAIEVPDRVGGFAQVMKTISDASVNVEYMYAFIEKHRDNAILIFRFDDTEKTVELLQSKGLNFLSSGEVLSL